MLRRIVGIGSRLAVAAVLAALVGACVADDRADVVVAAASDTRDAFMELAEVLQRDEGISVEFVFGSSGMLREQVLNGAPYDVYVSANVAFVDEVIAAGVAAANGKRAFAIGQLAMIAAPGVTLPEDLRELAGYRRIAIANPAHAPYGVAAREALTAAGLDEVIAARLILADNVADAVRIVEAGEADVGLVALPLVINDEHVVVSSSMHQPIRQSLVITSHGSGNAAAERFVALLESAEGRETLTRYGFIVEPS